MPTESETAYPRFKSTVTDRELREVYTPTPEECELARQHTTGTIAQVAFLILLKTFQRLGYAVSLTAVPTRIVDHIANQVGLTVTIVVNALECERILPSNVRNCPES